MSVLYIVGTPIGNLEDMTLRAIRVLKEVDVIAAEDTRHTKILLNKYNIETSLTSYHKFNTKEKTSHLISDIKKGRSIALVSDAGMPGISDPGYELVKEAVDNNIQVIPIPNTSALVVALSASGLKTDKFVFEGFLPNKNKDRNMIFEKLKKEERTIVIYEAPHRLVNTLEELIDQLGDRNICIARELTKKFEEFERGKLSELIKIYSKKKPKGEFVLIIEGNKIKEVINDNDLKVMLTDMINSGVSRKNAVAIISKEKNVPKNRLYKMSLSL